MFVTVKTIWALKPCESWPLERIRDFLGSGIAVKNPQALAMLQRLDIAYARWVIVRLLPHPQLVLWVQACAERARDYTHGFETVHSEEAVRCASHAAAAERFAYCVDYDCGDAKGSAYMAGVAAEHAAMERRSRPEEAREQCRHAFSLFQTL